MRKTIFSKFVLTLVSTLFLTGMAFAQERTLTGTVYDGETNEAMPGTTVMIKGTTTGATTDLDGNFQIKVTDVQTVVVSFVGYITEEIVVAGQSELTVNLNPELTELSEIIVIGYGTVKKEDKTGAVYNITSEDIQTVAVQDAIEGIQGKVPGVTIRKGGSDPNSGFEVRIRGANSLQSGSDPLYVVDGIVGVDHTTIAPEDIESINVLKDASSAAIYGSRGANGVIIITTKKGVKGQSVVDFSSYATFDQIASRSKLDLMSADEYRAYGEEIGKPVRDLGANTDWQDEIYRTGVTHNEQLSFSGGNEFGTYRASVSNMNMQGIVEGSAKNRTNMRLNAQTKALNERLNLSMNIAQTIEHNDYVNYGSSGADGVLYQAFQRNPTAPVKNEDGTFFQDSTPPVNNYSNPVAVINDIENTRDAKRFVAGFKADMKIVEGFVLTLNTGYTRSDDEASYFVSPDNGPLGAGSASRTYNNSTDFLGEIYGTYNKKVNRHSFQLIGGYTYNYGMWDGFSASGEAPTSTLTGADNLGSLTDVTPGDISSWRGERKLISGFGRFVYDYDKKYFLTINARRDGSSRFGENYKWGIFPSVSAGWNIKKESFLKDVDILSMLKPRFNYGQTGNQDIPDYANIALFGSKRPELDTETGEYKTPYDATQNPNPDLKWEVNTETGFGIDFGLYNNRFSGSFDYFYKKTTDLINYYDVDETVNLVGTTLANGGSFDISGLEFVITAHIASKKAISWYSTIALTHSKAEIISLGTDEFYTSPYYQTGYLQEPLGYGTSTQIWWEGHEKDLFYGPKFAGIDSRTGNHLYEKADGTFKTIDNIEFDDYQILGSTQPDLEIGWSNSITLLENIDVNFTFRGMFGHDILNATYMVFDNPDYFPTRNVLSTAPERNISGPSTFSDYWLEKGNFIRLENLTIGYKFNTDNVDWLREARVFLSGNNLLTITNYKGIDPSTIGVDIFNVYPKSTSVTVGFNMKF